jgi:hypothetical protein
VPKRYTFTFESRLRAAAPDLWEHATSMRGVNREFWPFLRMTYPPGREALGPVPPLGKRLFRSWILLFGVVPVDFDDLSFTRFEPGREFLECSKLGTMREWRHRRSISAAEDGAVLRDEVECVPRLAAGSILVPVFRAVFALRHRRLRRLFGVAGAAAAGSTPAVRA